MEMAKECPICEKDIFSGYSAEFCALCGMQVDNSSAITAEQDGIKRFFCDEICYERYNRFHEKIKGDVL